MQNVLIVGMNGRLGSALGAFLTAKGYAVHETASPSAAFHAIVCGPEAGKNVDDIPASGFVILLSSDSVFDGAQAPYTVFDSPKPKSDEGRRLVGLETRILDRAKQQAAILRAGKGAPSDLVIDSIALLIERRQPGIYHVGATGDSLKTRLPTKEAQYVDFLDTERVTMGLLMGYAYSHDPKRVLFTLSRYKFVAKMFSGLDEVLEVGCADGFATSLVLKEVGKLVATDFDAGFIDDARRTHTFAGEIDFRFHDMVAKPMDRVFDGAFSLDVLEHISKSDEDRFMNNITASLKADGVCIIGMPSLESQAYASDMSKQGHVNCKTGPELKSFLSRYFRRVFIFSMNDEVVHTGYYPMAQYLMALCCFPIRKDGGA